MVKKKKNRHQQEPATQNGGDSTESCDENQPNNTGGKYCPHINKAVDLTRVKKALRAGGIINECKDCAKMPATSNGLPAGEEVDVGLWLCLKCGHQACGRSRRQHALKHYQTPRSEPHTLAINVELWNIWCYDCGFEIAAQCRKKLHECVEFIKRQEETRACPKITCDIGSPKNDDRTSVGNLTKETLKTNKETAQASNLPRVRGLCNVGNTCFFNAVLQCLAQTPFLLTVLQEMNESGTKFQLQGQLSKEEELPVLEGELGKWGSLTEILASTLTELQSSKCDVFNPTRLLNKLIQRFPQFGGGEQHDSHELLRHLLEGVRTEDLKRYQIAILHLLGLSEKSNPSEVEDELRAKAKAYGRQAAQMMLHPEQVFRGFLVSTLECQDCLHTSQCVESFLDLSLPVIADKPQPPVMRRKSNNDESFDVCGNASEGQPSKHQLKKERRQARKERKRQKGCSAGGDQSSIAKENADMKISVESEQSDADVEDNVEQDTASRGRGVDVGESGYSSEKVGNEDSAVESPLPCLLNGDSALASPASPADIGGSVSPVGSADVAEMSSELVVTVPTSVSAVGSADVAEMSSELVVTIPTSPLESVGSPLSPSPVSSEVNIDCSSSVSAHAHMDCMSPDCNRPVSRFAFCNEDEMNNGGGVARLSPVEDTLGGTYNLVSGLCEDISRLCTTFVPVPGLCADGCEAKQLVCGGDVGGIGDEVELHVNDVASEVYLSGNELNRKMIREVQSNGDVADNVLSSGVIASEVQSNWAVADNVLSSGVIASEVQSNVAVADNVLSSGVIASEVQSNGDAADNVLSSGVIASEVQSNGAVADNVLSSGVIASEVQSNGAVADNVLSSGVMASEVQSNGAVADNVLSSGVMASEVQSNGDVADNGLSSGVIASEVQSNGVVTDNGLSSGVMASEVQSNGNVADNVLSSGVMASEVQSNGDVADNVLSSGAVADNVSSSGVMATQVQSSGVMANGMANWSATVLPRYQCDDGECSIQSCLNQFTALELMTGSNKVGCENCTQRQNQGKEDKMVCTNSTKQLLVKMPPAVLILHLKRFQVHRTMFRKMTRHVSFPLVLDLAPICSAMYKESLMMKPGQNQVLYALYGVVEHSGTLHGGHYVAYVKVRAPVQDKDPRWSFLPSDREVPPKVVDEDGDGTAKAPAGKWYCVSDSRVSEVGEDRVLRSQAYLLFYERIW